MPQGGPRAINHSRTNGSLSWDEQSEEYEHIPGDSQTPSRYSFHDTQISMHSSPLEYDDPPPQPLTTGAHPRPLRTSPSRIPSVPPSLPPLWEASEEGSTQSDGASISRHSTSSGGTIVDSGQVFGGDIHISSHHQKPFAYNALPTINSGEPLDWEDLQDFEGEDENPFADSSMHSRPSSVQSSYHTVRADLVDASGHETLQQPRLIPAYQADTAAYTLPPEQGAYDSGQPDMAYSHTGASSVMDHFNHDTEAYASGMYSRASYRPPRSRSPTPAVDDEDYRIVGNDSIHYVGESPQRYPSASVEDYEESDETGQDITYRPGFLSAKRLGPGYEKWRAYSDIEKMSMPSAISPYNDPETPVATRHFGPAPTGRALRRHKTKKRVKLTNGNLVVDLEVPPKMVLPWRGEPEMRKTRYTAVTCDPDEFEAKGHFLRQNELQRTTELFIVITMYNVRRTIWAISPALTTFTFTGRRGVILPYAVRCYAEHRTFVYA